MMEYNIISTGSHGNAVVLNNNILIDCGVSFKALQEVYKDLQIVLLTHCHTDHFNKTTIRMLAERRPTLRFACCEWLAPDLLRHEGLGGCMVNQRNIDVLEIGKIYDYGAFKVSPIKLCHDVPNCGYRLFVGEEKAIYATDTNTLDGITAEDYDLYLVEANYTEENLQERINTKMENGKFCYELYVAQRHLSKEQTDEWLIANMGAHSRYEYLHGHIDKSDDWGYEDGV